jgi:restriction system protein
MAEITRRRTGELLRKLFEILLQNPDGLQASEALKALASSVTLTNYEQGIYESSGTRRFDKIVRFATVDCVKAGWLLKHNGIWSITAAGEQAYQNWLDPEAFYKEACRLYAQWKSSRPGTSDTSALSSSDEVDGDDKSASITFEQAEEQAWAEIEHYLGAMNPYEFQDLVADLLKAMGYFVSWVSPPGKDVGVDIIAHTDPLGTSTPRIKVQVKRQVQKTDRSGLASFSAVVNDDEVGIFVSTGGFTKDAEEFARSHARRRVTLID